MQHLKDDIEKIDKKLVAHIEQFERRVDEDHMRFEMVMKSIEANTQAIASLTKSTEALITFNRDVQGFARIGSSVYRVLWALTKFGAVGMALYSVITFVMNKLDKIHL